MNMMRYSQIAMEPESETRFANDDNPYFPQLGTRWACVCGNKVTFPIPHASTTMVVQSHAKLRFGSPEGLPQSALAPLAEAVTHPPDSAATGALLGRAAPHFAEIPGLGHVFIKHYRRGGWVRHFVEHGHLWNPRSRGRREFETLQLMQRLGIPAPIPVAYAESGRLWQHTWLILALETRVQPLTEIAHHDPDRARKLLPELGRTIRELIRHRIHHVDLHPGNVLVGHDDRLVLVDFDKAGPSLRSPHRLALRYLKRWTRAVAKHRLPPVLERGLAQAIHSAPLLGWLPALVLLLVDERAELLRWISGSTP